MTLRRSGIVKTEHFHIDGPTYTLRLPIRKKPGLPNIHRARVDLVGAAGVPLTQGHCYSPNRRRAGRLRSQPSVRHSRAEHQSFNPPFVAHAKVTATPLKTTLAPGGWPNVTVKVQNERQETRIAGSGSRWLRLMNQFCR